MTMLRLPAILQRAYLIIILSIVLFPLLLVIPVSFSKTSYLIFPPPEYSTIWYQRVFGDRTWTEAAIVSLKVATATMALATVLGTLASLGIARWPFRGRSVIQSFVLAPMMIPIMVIAIAIYNIWARFNLVDTMLGLILAYTVLALPFVVATVTAVLQNFDLTLERAALSLGANHLRTFVHVTLPIISSGVLSGALFAFLIAFDEIVLALFLTGPYTATLPRRLWEGVRHEVNPSVAVVATLLMAVELVLFAAAALFFRSRRMNQPG